MRALLFTLAVLCTSCSALLPVVERGAEAVTKDVVEEVAEESIEYVVRIEILKVLFGLAFVVVIASSAYKVAKGVVYKSLVSFVKKHESISS